MPTFAEIDTRRAENTAAVEVRNQVATIRRIGVRFSTGTTSFPELVAQMDSLRRAWEAMEAAWTVIQPDAGETTRFGNVRAAIDTMLTDTSGLIMSRTVAQMAETATVTAGGTDATIVEWRNVTIPAAITTPAAALVTAIDAL